MFKDFGRRLQRDVKKRVDARLDANVKRLGSLGKQAAPQKPTVLPAPQSNLSGRVLGLAPKWRC